MLIALASAKGSPGVTTTARVLASVWPTDVALADLDPVGGDLAVLARAEDGGVLEGDRGLLSLAALARHGPVADDVPEHLQRIEGGLDVLVGTSGPEQTSAVAPAMPVVAEGLAGCGIDVVADCGRLSPDSAALPVVLAADVTLLVVRPRVEAYAHLRERVRWLSTTSDRRGRTPNLAVVVVTGAHDQRSARDLQQVLGHAGLDVPVLGRVADDERAAAVVGGRLQRPISRSLLVRSVRELVGPVRALGSQRFPATTY